MKFVLFVEGKTEGKALPEFFKRWLDPELAQPVRIQIVKFNGRSQFLNQATKKAELHNQREDVIAVIALLDWYPILKEESYTSTSQHDQRRNEYRNSLAIENFFFAVHELEAWLLSDSRIFPPKIRSELEKSGRQPEEIDNEQPPAKLLKKLYREQTGKRYKKITDGTNLFRKLDPSTAYEKCPHFRTLMDTMLRLAKERES